MLRPSVHAPLLATILLPLAACDGGTGGTSISINAADADGPVVARVNGGQATIDMPLFKGKVAIPKLALDSSNFDMHGVHLYPGSTISGINVDARGGRGGKDDDDDDDDNATVHVVFASPAAPATVRDWFKDKLRAADFKVEAQGDGLVGRTGDGKPFALDLTPDGTNKAKGDIKIG